MSKESLKLAILEYEKDLETDKNNQWVKNVLKGLKKCEQDLERLEELEKENQKLKEIIKANFGYEKGFTYCDQVYFNYNAPVMEEEIKEVLEND